MRVVMLQTATIRYHEENNRRELFESGLEYDIDKAFGEIFVENAWAKPASEPHASGAVQRNSN